jgi:translation initiation factor IF-2
VSCTRRRRHHRATCSWPAGNAPIIGFNVRANKQARDLAEREGVEIRYYSIIYDLIDDVKAAVGHAGAGTRETFLGYAESCRSSTSRRSARSPAAGHRRQGRARRGVRLLRDNVVIHEGTLSTLKRFKDEVKEVQASARNAACCVGAGRWRVQP